MRSYSACIIGCGKMGTFFDRPDSQYILTHAKAFTLHPRIRLQAVVDIDTRRAVSAGKRWECDPYNDLEAMFQECNPDIVSICVPDAFHYEYLERCSELKPKAVIAEKPLTLDLESSQQIVNRYADIGISLAVNYTRRYDEFFPQLRDQILAGDLGRIFHASFRYSKGILHSGSHAVDLANFLFGEFRSGMTIYGNVDYQQKDPTLNAVLCYSKNPAVYLMGCDERAYSIFEVDIISENGRIIFDETQLHCRKYSVGEKTPFKGYKVLVEQKRFFPRFDGAILNLADNVVQHLDNKSPLLCTGKDALYAQEICQQLVAQYLD